MSLPISSLFEKVHSLISVTIDDYIARALESLRYLGYYLRFEDFSRAIPPDEFDEEILVMAEVRSFFQVVYKASARLSTPCTVHIAR